MLEQIRGSKFNPSYKEIKGHTIFDIKVDGKFTCKKIFVEGDHRTDPPPSITYSIVVSRDSIRIFFMLASLNNLDICDVDIGNPYLNFECREKVWFEAVP